MSSWEDFKNDMIKLKDKFIKGASKLTKISNIKLKIYNLEGEKEKCFKQIGIKVYEYYKSGKTSNSAITDKVVKSSISRIESLENSIKELNSELEKVKKFDVKSDNN